jgi:hypothetical protein
MGMDVPCTFSMVDIPKMPMIKCVAGGDMVMKKKRDREARKAGGAGKSDDGLEQQAQDIMRSSDLEELDRAEIPDELRERLEETDFSGLDDLEEEFGLSDDVTAEAQPEMPMSRQPSTQPADNACVKKEKHAGPEKEPVDASCSVKISEDSMSALISLYPSMHNGKPLDFAMVKSELDSRGVVYGINEELVKKLIITVEKTQEEKEGVMIAKGLAPEEGKDGYIEYHFGEDESVLYQSNEGEDEETT